MKALTLTQPWAQLVADGRKRWETRGWRTGYVGPLAIHAAGRWTRDDEAFARECGYGFDGLPHGAVVAVASLALIVPTGTVVDHLSDQEVAFGDYSPGRHAWRLDDVRRLALPVTARGALGLWSVAPDLEHAIRAVLP